MFNIFCFLKRAARSARRDNKSQQRATGLAPYHRRLLCEALEARALLSGGAAQYQSLAGLSVAAQSAEAAGIDTDAVATQTAKLTAADGRPIDLFGKSVAISGDTLVVGAVQGNNNEAGAAYVFTKSGSGWTQAAKLVASDGQEGSEFGCSVAISGNTVVVGADNAVVAGNSGQGEAYVFTEPASGWTNMTETAKLIASDGALDYQFGASVAISGNRLIVGSPRAAIDGESYVFTESGTAWSQTARLTPSNQSPAGGGYGFGTSVAISGNTAAVSGPFGQVNGYEGQVCVFTEPAAGWTDMTQSAILTASDAQVDSNLGSSISISGSTIVASGLSGGAGHLGAAYVYIEPASGWTNMTQTAELTSSDGTGVGLSVAISGNTIVAGASGATVGVANDEGAAYVFTEPISGWSNMTQAAIFTASDGAAYDEFGGSVAMSGNTLVVGTDKVGAAYVFANVTGVTSVSSTTASGTYGTGTAIPITVTFNAPVTVSGTPQLTLNAGSGATAIYTSGGGTSTLTFTYTVGAGQSTPDLDYASTAALVLNGGTIQDAAGNAETLLLPATATDGLATKNIVVAVLDGFESGDFNALAWQTSTIGTASNWTVETSAVHSGTYAAESGLVGSASSSTLRLTLTVGAGELSFWRKTSSASGGGSLIFEIDGVPQLQLSGTMPWQQSFFWVSAGQHTFAWVYGKNAGDSAGNDYACLDDVEFVAGTTLIVDGATSDDQCSINASGASASGGPIVVTLNGEGHDFTAAEFNKYVFHGAGGTVSLMGSASGNTAVLSAGGAGQLTNSTAGYTVAVDGMTVIDAFGHAGDMAQFFDSPQSDVFYAYDDYGGTGSPLAGMYGTGYSNTASGFGTNVGNSTNGRNDTAVFIDSAGNALFYSYADYLNSGRQLAGMLPATGSAYSNSASGFAANVAITTNGSNDQAVFFDSPNDDTFYSYSDYQASGEQLSGMLGGGYSNSASGFGSNIGISSNGGSDTAVFFDSPASDTFYAYGAYAGGGPKLAGMYGSYGGGYQNAASGFYTMLGISTNGGTDTATLSDSLGTNTLSTTPTTARLVSDQANYGEMSFGFSVVNAYGAWGSQNTMGQGNTNYQLNYYGTWVPGGYSITANQAVVDAAHNRSTGFTFADAVTGTTYSYIVTSSNGGLGYPLTGSGSVTAAAQAVTGIDVESLSDGILTYSVTLTNAAGQTGAAATATATLDTVGPRGYTITASPSSISQATAANAGFILAGAQTGTTYFYFIDNLALGGSVNGNGSVTSAVQYVTGINVSSLPDGILTYTVALFNDLDQSGPSVTATAVLYTAAPSGYTISADQPVIEASQATTAGISFAGAEVGTTYNYTIVSSGGGTPVTGSGSVTSAAQDVTGINVSSLPDGTLTYSVTLTNEAGNVGAVATASAALDTTAPSGYTISADQSVINASQTTAAGFTFANATTGTTYNYAVTSNGGAGSVTGSGSVTAATQDVTGINVSSLSDGTLTFSVTLTDVAGNIGAAATATATLEAALVVTSTPATSATVGQVYTYTVQTNAPSGETVTVTPGTLPTGMTFDGVSTFTWTPTADQAGTAHSFSATIADSDGNSATLGPVFVEVAAASGLTVIAAPPSIAVGSPELIAFNSTNSGTPNFSVTTSDPTELAATLMPQTNPVLKIDTNIGDMEIQLLANYTPNTVTHIVDLVNSGAYASSASFYRVIENFMIQGGVGGSGSGSTIPVELNPDLRFTTSGLLAMANDGVDGNGSEFFITGPDDTSASTNGDFSDGFLDFRYTIFGKLISGDNVRQAIAATQVTTNSSGEDSQPVTPVTITSMSIVSNPDAGVVMLSAQSGATGSYTVTVSDGLGGTQTFTVNASTTSSTGVVTAVTNPYDPPNPWVEPINGTDQITTAANTPVTFTPQGESADGSPVQVDVQLFRDVPSVSGAYVDNSYTGTNPPADTTNADMTLTQNGSSYTVTPASGFYGDQVLEVTAVTGISGTFSLQVGSVTTDPISFDSTDLATTAANMQSALQNAGFSGATVSVVSPTTSVVPTDFSFNVTFASSESPITYVPAATALPVTATNSVTAAAPAQTLTFAETSPGTSWDSSSNVDALYRAYVPVMVAPPAPQIDSISAGGQTLSGSTSANNSTAASELSFNITGAVGGATVSVYMDGGATPIATGIVASVASTITVTTDGTTAIALGSHTFTVVQTIATPALELYAGWSTGSEGPGPGAEFPIAAGSVASPASAGTGLTINAAVPPSGYSISADEPVINNTSEADSTGFTLANAPTDTTYIYTVTSSGGSGSVTGSGGVTSATQDVTGINVSSLSDGNLTFSVTLTDMVGNVGAPATTTATLDTSA